MCVCVHAQRSRAAPAESYKWVYMWAGWSMSTFISWQCSSGRTGDTGLEVRPQCESEAGSASYGGPPQPSETPILVREAATKRAWRGGGGAT